MPITPQQLATLSDPFSSLGSKYDVMIALGWTTVAGKADILQQEAYYNANKAQIEQQNPGKFIAIANQQVFATASLETAENAARAAFPSRQVYVASAAPLVLGPRFVTGAP